MSAVERDFPDRGPAVFAVVTATLVLASVFVVARWISRVWIVGHRAADDYMISLAWVLALALGISTNMATHKGLGRHDADIVPEEKPMLRKIEYTFSILYNPGLMATKTSILIFYLGLSKSTQRVLRICSWVVLAIVNVAGVILTVMNTFQCRPIRSAWDVHVHPTKCLPLLTEFICSAPISIVTDLAILALPIPVLTRMRLPPRQKTMLVLNFALGIFVTVTDVVRIYYLQKAITLVAAGSSDKPAAIFGETAEFSWNASLSLMWSAVEVNVGITCACIPTLKPLIDKMFPAMVDPEDTGRSRASMQRQHDNMTTAAATAGAAAVWPKPRSTLECGHDGRPNRNPASFLSYARTASISSKVPREAVYFGFVNMKKPKSMVSMSRSESWRYCTLVSLLFFLWGFSYGLLNRLNNVVAKVSGISTAQKLGLTSMYFGCGYLLGPLLVGECIIRHEERVRRRTGMYVAGGFKTSFMVGLLMYACGTIIFWPSAVLGAWGGFMVSSLVVGFGLAVLETAANPFLALCGPPEYSDMRLLLAQGVQAVGSLLSGLLADRVFFGRLEPGDFNRSTALLDVQWTYLAITLLCYLLAVFFYYMPLPEVGEEELAGLAGRLPVDANKRSIGGVALKTWCIVLAVAAQWLYVGAQECMSIFFSSLMKASDRAKGRPTGLAVSISNYRLLSHTAFAVSRFTCGYLAYVAVGRPGKRFVPTPRTTLTVSTALSALLALVIVVLPRTGNPNLMAIPVTLFFLAEGPRWPLIFSLGLRGQGGRTRRAAAWLTMGASGPAFWPFAIFAITHRGGNIQTGFVVVVALMVLGLVYPLFLTFCKDARTMVDPCGDMAALAGGEAGDVPDRAVRLGA